MVVASFGVTAERVAADDNIGHSWFAVYVSSRHEKRVAQHLQMLQIEHFLPLYASQRKWKDGSRPSILFPLFPNYLFVRIRRKERVPVLGVPGVLWIVGGGNESATIPEDYMQFLRESLLAGKTEPHPYLVTGKIVRVKSGPLAGMQGVLVTKKNSFRVVVTLELIQRSVAVELDPANLELCSYNRLRQLTNEEDEVVFCGLPAKTGTDQCA